MRKALTSPLCLLMLASLTALAVADGADSLITYTFSGAPYGGQDVILSFPSDYTIVYSGLGGIENISNGQIEIKPGVRDGSAHSSVEEFVEAYAGNLRKYKSALEVRHENGVCYLYVLNGEAWQSGTVTAYYDLNEQTKSGWWRTFQLTVNVKDMNLYGEEAIAIATSGVLNP